MKIGARRGIPLFLLVAITIAQPQAFTELESVVVSEMQSSNIPGVAVAVVRGDSVVFAKGFGVANTEAKTPVSTDTVFQIGSLTKVFTSAAVLTAAQNGNLKL